MKKSFIVNTFIVGIFVAIIIGGVTLVTIAKKPSQTSSVTPTPITAEKSIHYFGKEGRDALSLLKEGASVHESAPGFVDEINGRKANSTKHEYWAFYVNGKLSDVGAAQYMTHATDNIVWKIETY